MKIEVYPDFVNVIFDDIDEAENCCHISACDEGCLYMVRENQDELYKIPEERLVPYIKSCGVNGVEEMDHDTLLLYFVWLVSTDFLEDTEDSGLEWAVGC